MDLIDNPILLKILEHICKINWNSIYDLIVVCKKWRDVIQYLISKNKVQIYKKLVNKSVMKWHDTYKFEVRPAFDLLRKLKSNNVVLHHTRVDNFHKIMDVCEYEVENYLSDYDKAWINDSRIKGSYNGMVYKFQYQKVKKCNMIWINNSYVLYADNMDAAYAYNYRHEHINGLCIHITMCFTTKTLLYNRLDSNDKKVNKYLGIPLYWVKIESLFFMI